MTDVDGEGQASVRTVAAVDPVAAAEALVEELGADLADDLTGAERQVRLRVEAGRRALEPEGADDAAVLARAAAIREAAAIEPPIADADVEELERLAADLARAARIRARTEARFTENLQARLAASVGVALHPAAIKEAGEAVVAAEAAFTAAEAALEALGPRPAPGAAAPPVAEQAPAWAPAGAIRADGTVDDPVLRRPHDDFDEVALDRRRARTQGVALALVLVGLGVIALGAGAPTALGAALAVAGVVLGVVVAALASRRAATARPPDAGNDLLDALPDVTGATAVPPTPPQPEPEPTPEVDADEAWLDRRVALEAARDEAEEEVRATRRRWHQLAGLDADPSDVDAVVRAHDPQLAFDARVAEASPTVRTVAAFHRKAQARWRVLWNAIGHDDPPEADQLDAVLEDLLGDHRRRQAELRRLEEAQARAGAEAEARRPLVLVEPSRWVSPGRLTQLLASVPPQGEVVLVERDGAS